MDARLCCGRLQLHQPESAQEHTSAIEGRGLVGIAPIAVSELVAIEGGRNAPLAVIRLLWAVLVRSGVRSVWLPGWLPVLEHSSEKCQLSCAPSRIRTCGLLLRRHFRHIARRRWVSPDVLFSCTDSRWAWLGVAWHVSLLAPRLAPQ